VRVSQARHAHHAVFLRFSLPTLKRHRLVNEFLKEQIAELHAFSQKTFTPKVRPSEWLPETAC